MQPGNMHEWCDHRYHVHMQRWFQWRRRLGLWSSLPFMQPGNMSEWCEHDHERVRERERERERETLHGPIQFHVKVLIPKGPGG